MKQVNLLFIAALLTGCGSGSEPANPFAPVVSDDVAQDTASPPEPVTQAQPEPALVTPEPAEETVAIEQVAEPAPIEPASVVIAQPIQSPVFATPDPFFGVAMVCSYNDTEANGIQPDEFFQFTLNEDGTYVGNSIPFRFESVAAWSHSDGVVFLSGQDWTIDGSTLVREGAACVEQVDNVVEPLATATIDGLFGIELNCVIYGEDTLSPHTLMFSETEVIRTNLGGAPVSGSWTRIDNGVMLENGETMTFVDGKLTSGVVDGREYTCST